MSAKFRVNRVYSNSISGLVLEGSLKKGMALKTNSGIVRVSLISVRSLFTLSNIITLLAMFLGGAGYANSTIHPNEVKSGSRTVELTLTGMDGISIQEGDTEFNKIALTDAEEDLAAVHDRSRDIMINRIIIFLLISSLGLLFYGLLH